MFETFRKRLHTVTAGNIMMKQQRQDYEPLFCVMKVLHAELINSSHHLTLYILIEVKLLAQFYGLILAIYVCALASWHI